MTPYLTLTVLGFVVKIGKEAIFPLLSRAFRLGSSIVIIINEMLDGV
jgi:hypothetical protein